MINFILKEIYLEMMIEELLLLLLWVMVTLGFALSEAVKGYGFGCSRLMMEVQSKGEKKFF